MAILIEVKNIHLHILKKIEHTLLIGRSEECDIVLNSFSIDLIQAKFINDENHQLYFEDLTTNPKSRLNNKIVRPSKKYLIGIDDQIIIGAFTFSVCTSELSFFEKFNLQLKDRRHLPREFSDI